MWYIEVMALNEEDKVWFEETIKEVCERVMREWVKDLKEMFKKEAVSFI